MASAIGQGSEEMGPGGFEPPTSWVRLKRLTFEPLEESAYLQGCSVHVAGPVASRIGID
jgi:hypothetical protein